MKNGVFDFFLRNFVWMDCLSALKNYKILKGHKNITLEADSEVLW